MPEFVRQKRDVDGVVKVERAIDAVLDAHSALIHKRDSTLRQMDLWQESDPSLTEILEDLRLHLL